jgi:hypothetical protein
MDSVGQVQPDRKEPVVTIFSRTLAGLALEALVALAAAGAYTEAHRVPDQS